ncbi:hypothetical protein [Anabaena azotica]|uniref:Uncharacterized protein n=1 Tax=Anabaena azotica FACHB-119 TaxID=947527 RepID=A0ABR8DCE2_9NOST|nr:hypothetical protein [Anabaena azotica]MBD2504900.1 hypothetical protein [Anabaena azotica FACHB-119]
MRTDKIAEIIPAANKQGFLKPIREPNICFTDSLNQANFLLWLLNNAGENGLSTSQIAHKSGLHKNTCRCYLREFMQIGLLGKQLKSPEDAVWFLKQKISVR